MLGTILWTLLAVYAALGVFILVTLCRTPRDAATTNWERVRDILDAAAVVFLWLPMMVWFWFEAKRDRERYG